ncbi:L,D-transpeptidase family protein [Bifidobacterium sp. SMB2]|uniref:L,D-transpeptidase family protein n=1 Tax=Bifidobacterium saimiriisciurei TaxID=2661627 RepID=A0ABX0CG65_9BIFI|nr:MULTISPECIES: L,D-transpeptidase [Bifidobacterium]NEG95235.1 L,D-transpeptidase family protein [Bifidobacterium sp. SMB2]NEH11312.1 L,D-transpeptidase family protein [Bifidobacterium saimiriisciurei]
MTNEQNFENGRPEQGASFDFLSSASAPDEAQTVTMAPLPASASGDVFNGAATVRTKKKPVGLIVALTLLVVVLAAFAGYIIGGQYYFKDKAAPGVRLGTISVAGQTSDELKNTVTDAVRNSSVKVTVKGGASTTASLTDLGVSVNVDKTVNDLMNANKENFISTVNPFAKTSVSLETSGDKLAMTTFLSDKLIGEDSRVVNATVKYDSSAKKFVVSNSRDGESPKIAPVQQAVNAIKAEPGDTKSVEIGTETIKAPISDATATKAADDANARLASQLVISNGDTKTFTIPADQIATWIKVNEDPTKGTIALSYDESAINSYLSSTLPDALNQKMVAEQNVVNTAGTVITTDVKGVNGVEVNSDASATTKQVCTALRNGTSGTIKADAKVVKYETKSRKVRYDVPNGDPHMVINLSEQKAYAYKGTTLVNTFNVSTGKPSTPTDNGTFFVHTKYESQTMRGEDYVTPNVPWVTYYNEGEGFHGAPWNPDGIASGTPKSHGCTNMNVADAKWVYDFMPIGAMVEVTGSTPSGAVR